MVKIYMPSKELNNINIKIRTQSLKSLISVVKEGILTSKKIEELRIQNLSKINMDDEDIHEVWTAEESFNLEYVNYFEGNLECSQLENIATYSIITSCYMLFETNLVAFAKIAHEYYSLSLKYNELSGGKTDKIKNYLKKLINIDISNINSWNDLKDLEKIRNCIVHNDGKINTDFNEEDRKKIENLKTVKKYENIFSINKPLHEDENYMIVKFSLCEFFIEKIESFFDDLVDQFGFNQNFYFGKEASEKILKERIKAKIEFDNDIKKAKEKYDHRMEQL